jgi:hypothetical protein
MQTLHLQPLKYQSRVVAVNAYCCSRLWFRSVWGEMSVDQLQQAGHLVAVTGTLYSRHCIITWSGSDLSMPTST